MDTTKTDSTTKLIKESKASQEVKKKQATAEAEWDWRPLAADLAITLTKACITAFAFKLSGQFYDYSFNRKATNASLTLLEGGRKVA